MTEICNVSKEQYKIIQNSDKKVKEVLYRYRFNGKYVDRFYVFPKEGAKEDNYYIDKAKNIVAEEKENGKLAKYSVSYLQDFRTIRWKRVALATFIPLAVVGVAIGGVFLTKYLVNQPLPEVGDAAAIEVATNILSTQAEKEAMMPFLLEQVKTGKIEMSTTSKLYGEKDSQSESHKIDFDFANDEFYFKDEYQYDDEASGETKSGTQYYLYRKTSSDINQSGVYYFYKDSEQLTPDKTGTMSHFGYRSDSIMDAIQNFDSTLSKLTFFRPDFADYYYQDYLRGYYPLLQTSFLEITKNLVAASQKTHPDSYIKTSFHSDKKDSLVTKIDFVYYDTDVDQRYYENIDATINKNLCYECEIATDTGKLTNRRNTSYKLIPGPINKDNGYDSWRIEGEN